MALIRFICGLGLVLVVSGCATSSKNFNTKDIGRDEGVILGKLQIIIDGEDFTDQCYVGFNGENKPYVSLDKTGTVIAKAKKGRTTLSYLICTDYGFITVNHSCRWNDAAFINAGDGKQTYFGSLRIVWSPSGTGMRKVAAALGGGLGAGLASASAACGSQLITIANDPGELKKAYSAIDPAHIQIETSLISKPTGGK